LSQITISSVMAQIGNHTNIPIEEDLIRHVVLNKLRVIRQKYKDYGDMVIACDDKNNWRRKVFPYYKANRKKAREASEFDWNSIFESLNKIRDEIKESFPYVVIQIETSEADDIIGSLVHKHGVELNNDSTEKIVIISGDKDFVQLQRFANVEQYDPVRHKQITHPDPVAALKEHIFRGDTGDGVPNVLSGDNFLSDGIRQKRVTEKKIAEWILQDPETFNDDLKRNYKRNEQLIDLGKTPKVISDTAIEQYEQQRKCCDAKRRKMFNYFIKHKLKNLMENIGEF